MRTIEQVVGIYNAARQSQPKLPEVYEEHGMTIETGEEFGHHLANQLEDAAVEYDLEVTDTDLVLVGLAAGLILAKQV